MRSNLKTLFIGFFGGLAGAFLVFQLMPDNFSDLDGDDFLIPSGYVANYEHEHEPSVDNYERIPVDNFVVASKKSTESVVYIKTVSERYGRSSWLDMWLGGSGSMQQVGSGSGVIFKQDGYILTNNHVIEDADNIEVVYKKRVYSASLIGRDPSTDLAVLKIDANNLPVMEIGSSKNLEVGEWVLAVGNPFNLNSTVTAGIVSAKGRELNILKSNFPIESFIQTDAAINPGNSGGALVNVDGQLVGINTAILSQTGSYTGYGFAVPIDIAKKIANDIITYGIVQKAFLGAEVASLTPELADKLNVKDLDGVVISYLQEEGAANKMKLQKGDIIRQINGEKIGSHAEFEEKLSLHSPGDKLYITLERNGKKIEKELILTNSQNTTERLNRVAYFSEALGVEFEAVPRVEQNLLDITSGVRVVDIKNGFFRKLNIEEGFIITAINEKPIDDPKRLASVLEEIKGKVIIKGVNKKGVKGYYSYYF
ncbi:serine protease [Marivirga lumbricoides]|uniref:Serine protease n=2 Tax=Marivirga lumbricoides TaxID=1046115 RepID=A0ABQ1MXC9_9BACT|nr:serine protease [Marivirga lumbricoides]